MQEQQIEIEIINVFTPAVRIGGRVLTPESQPQNEVEAGVVAVLKESREDLLLMAVSSKAMAELVLWDRVKEVAGSREQATR